MIHAKEKYSNIYFPSMGKIKMGVERTMYYIELTANRPPHVTRMAINISMVFHLKFLFQPIGAAFRADFQHMLS